MIRIDTQPSLADGLAVAELGQACFEPIQNAMDDLVMVDEAQIASAVLRLLELEKTVVEGAGRRAAGGSDDATRWGWREKKSCSA